MKITVTIFTVLVSSEINEVGAVDWKVEVMEEEAEEEEEEAESG